jgi:hypothetical protein
MTDESDDVEDVDYSLGKTEELFYDSTVSAHQSARGRR